MSSWSRSLSGPVAYHLALGIGGMRTSPMLLATLVITGCVVVGRLCRGRSLRPLRRPASHRRGRVVPPPGTVCGAATAATVLMVAPFAPTLLADLSGAGPVVWRSGWIAPVPALLGVLAVGVVPGLRSSVLGEASRSRVVRVALGAALVVVPCLVLAAVVAVGRPMWYLVGAMTVATGPRACLHKGGTVGGIVSHVAVEGADGCSVGSDLGLMPCSDGKRGKPFRDHRQVVEGIIYRYRTGVAWRDLPEEFGPWQTVWKRHRRLAGDGTWDQVLAVLLAGADAAGSWAGRSAWTPRSTGPTSTART